MSAETKPCVVVDMFFDPEQYVEPIIYKKENSGIWQRMNIM